MRKENDEWRKEKEGNGRRKKIDEKDERKRENGRKEKGVKEKVN